MKNSVYLASAGSGKTTLLVRKACEVPSTEYVLMLTYTDSNEQEIRNKFYKENDGIIPKNVFIMTWFSFLLRHLIKPYQDYVTDDDFDIKGLVFPNNDVNVKNKQQKFRRIRKTNWKQYYFTKNQRILSEKISELAFECNDKSKDLPIERLTNIFDNIYIDEVQDLAGYDLELIRLFFLSKSKVVLAGDPRQTIYLTNHNAKNPNYREGKILDYLNDCKQLKNKYSIDTNTLNHSWRCCKEICNYASMLSPNFPQMNTNLDYQEHNCGVFLVKQSDCMSFVEQNENVMQLRWSKTNKKVIGNKGCKNFGDSKGQTFDSVLIYPTKEMAEWIENHNTQLKTETRNKFYVAVTRAKYIVGIVWNKKICTAQDISFWNKNGIVN